MSFIRIDYLLWKPWKRDKSGKVQNMNLGFGQKSESKRADGFNVMRLSLIAIVLTWAGEASAQDMSFDLDEAENAEAEVEAEAGAEGEAEAGAEGGAEVGAEAGAEADLSAEGDIFAELSSEGEGELEGEQATGPKQKEVAEEIYAVQRMYVLRRGRFEVAPALAFSANDPYVSHKALAGSLNYWVTNVLAVGVNFLWYQGLESESELNFAVRRSTRLAVPITEYQLGAHLNFTYVPIYGKFTMFNDPIFQWDAYLIGGVGMLRTRPVAVVDPAVRKFDFDWRVSFNAGVGIRVFVTRWLTIFGELRDYLYLEKLENLEVELGQARNDEATWIDDSASLTHNVTVQVGLTLFFPFTFEYQYPK
ncbi:MAG: outer membrane beta-barrel domain-containing protein [Myxococcales bacterium]|nr:outer membrane beta-barrel domain-containing protein [Myxococcales bacterium]